MPDRPSNEIAAEILESCLRRKPVPYGLLGVLVERAVDPDPGVSAPAAAALFGGIAEPMADLFESGLCERYAEVFAEVVSRACPELDSAALVERYRRVRRPRRFEGDPTRIREVYVLSRVTLGADVVVTSPVLATMKALFPDARVYLAGSRKSWELFARAPGILHFPVSYSRGGTLRERLSAWAGLRDALERRNCLVIDTDSRLTQLGLLPVCPEEKYFLFESRSYGGDGSDPLGALVQRWLGETFGTAAAPFVAPEPACELREAPWVSVSLGVGENPAKRVPDPFEEELVRLLLGRGLRLAVDKGAGGEERERVERALARAGARDDQVRTLDGSFAAFAAVIAGGAMYAGYDSAGQHVAACCGVPLLSVFAGHVSQRMFARWHPFGPGPKEVVRVDTPDPDAVLARVSDALGRLALR